MLKILISIFNIVPFKQGDVLLRKNTVHSFENALLGGCHFSRVARLGLMSVARFSWVPNLYNIHFLVENHRPQPDPVNSHPVSDLISSRFEPHGTILLREMHLDQDTWNQLGFGHGTGGSEGSLDRNMGTSLPIGETDT